jgi:tetratricopeptide (TPR) repeat protein
MRKIGTKVLLAALLGVVTLTGTASAGWWDGVGDTETIDLREVIENPRKWKGKEIVFECYFHETSDFYNPYYTRFLPDQYVNFSAWPAGTKLWNKEEFSNSFHFLFLEKDHKKFGHLVGLKKFTHLKLRGYVQNTFKNAPWIEVRAVEVLKDGYTRHSLREVILGDRAADREQWDVALGHYDRAAEASMPQEVMAGLEKKRGQAYEGLGRYDAAATAYRRAVEMDRRDHEAMGLLTDISERLGRPMPAPGTAPKVAAPDGAMAEARPVEEGRYPPAPMAIPAPVKATEDTTPAAPTEVPVEAEDPADEPGGEPIPTDPAEATPPVEVEPVEATPPAPIRKKTNPKKRMSGPV